MVGGWQRAAGSGRRAAGGRLGSGWRVECACAGLRYLQVEPEHRVVAIEHPRLRLARQLVLRALRRAGVGRVQQSATSGRPRQLAAHREWRVAPVVLRHLAEEEVELRGRIAQLLCQLGVAHGTLPHGGGGR